MEKIYLSDSGSQVSPAAYGFYRASGSDVNEEKMERIVKLCLALGIHTFDHGASYGGYTCEQIFGNVFKRSGSKRESIVLFTKCGINVPHAARPDYRVKHYDTSREHILNSLENSLRNLRTD